MLAQKEQKRTETSLPAAEDHLGLVHSCAHRFQGRGVEYDDLFQAGCIGLVKASSAFDPQRGVMFSTYAVPVILGEIRRLFRDGGTVKVSRSVKELGIRAVRLRERMSTELGREPTVGELSERLEVSVELLTHAISATAPPVSLTGEDPDGDNCGQIDLPVDSPEEHMADLLSLEQEVAMLSERDRQIVRLRYSHGLTQTRTADLLGMTQVQVSRREKKILDQLRRRLV